MKSTTNPAIERATIHPEYSRRFAVTQADRLRRGASVIYTSQ
jgi:hypothetical protein